MSIFTILRDTFRPGSRLRNKAGGMAWIRRYGEEYGAGVLAGQIVRTERFDGEFWRISPQPRYTTTARAWSRHQGVIPAGSSVQVDGMPDEFLEPIPETGVTKEEVADLYAPKVPDRYTA